MAALRRAKRVEQVRTIVALAAIAGRIFPLTILLLIATGLLMAVIAWGVQAWDGVALISFVLIVVPPVALEAHIHDPVLGTALQTITALLLGIVFLMTTKPTLVGSILVMAIAVVLGLASGLPLARAKRGSRRQER